MAKIKYTKNELKKQKDSLKRFERYLPTLELKRKQLQVEINRIKGLHEAVSAKEEELKKEIETWSSVFGEDVGFNEMFKVGSLELSTTSIAGVDIPVLDKINFDINEYDIFIKPLWVDSAVEEMKKLITLKTQRQTYEKQIRFLKDELAITTQRVNLFEKIKIPEAKENIRIINIFLGDEQTAGVVRGKIAKAKLEKKA